MVSTRSEKNLAAKMDIITTETESQPDQATSAEPRRIARFYNDEQFIVPLHRAEKTGYGKNLSWVFHNGLRYQARQVDKGYEYVKLRDFQEDQRCADIRYALYDAKFKKDDKGLNGRYLLFAQSQDAVHLWKYDALPSFEATFAPAGKQTLVKLATPPPSVENSTAGSSINTPNNQRADEVKDLKERIAILEQALETARENVTPQTNNTAPRVRQT